MLWYLWCSEELQELRIRQEAPDPPSREVRAFLEVRALLEVWALLEVRALLVRYAVSLLLLLLSRCCFSRCGHQVLRLGRFHYL